MLMRLLTHGQYGGTELSDKLKNKCRLLAETEVENQMDVSKKNGRAIAPKVGSTHKLQLSR